MYSNKEYNARKSLHATRHVNFTMENPMGKLEQQMEALLDFNNSHQSAYYKGLNIWISTHVSIP